MKGYKLTHKQYVWLEAALRRYVLFGKDGSLTDAWTGLGTYTDYKPLVDAGLMTYVHKPKPRCLQWWKLTERGAEIVQHWIDLGITADDNWVVGVPPSKWSEVGGGQ